MNITEKKAFNKELITLAIPLALQQLLHALVGATDALVLGRLTQEAIAAVSLANQISFIMSLFYGAVVTAVGILIAQYWGKQEYSKAKRFLGMAIRYVAIISLVFAFSAYFFPEQLMRIFTPEQELVFIGAEHLKILSFSYLFSGLSHCFLMVMKISGYAKMSVWISVIMVTADIIADIFLVYGAGEFKGLGSSGTAYSTIAVEGIALVWCVIWSLKTKKLNPAVSDLFSFSKKYENDLWKIIPGIFMSNISWGLSISVHSLIVGHLGEDATAAYSVVVVTQQLIQCLSHGLSSGAGIMIGGLLGDNQLEKAKKYGNRFWRIAAISGFINIGLLAAAGPLVYVFYVLEPQAKTYLVQMLIFMGIYMFAYAYNTIITCGVFPAGGDSKYDAVSVVIATWFFAVPLSLFGCFLFDWPVIVVFIVMCLDEIVKVPFIKRRYNKFIWLKNLTKE